MKKRIRKSPKAQEPQAAYGLSGGVGASTVKIAEFKAKLSHYLRGVKAGHPLTLMDRQTPVARLVPYEDPLAPLRIRKATHPLKDFKLPPPLKLKVDPVQYLLEDRNSGR